MRDLRSRACAWAAALAAAACVCSGSAVLGAAVVPASTDPDGEFEDVLVTAVQPGPGLWRISKGGHVLWVLATTQALPKGMKWKTADIDRILASSQAVLGQPGITPHANIGLFSVMGLLPTLIGVEKLPHGATLQQVLDPPVYLRWTAERQAYIGGSLRLEHLRPFIAVDKLAAAARKRANLTDDGEVIATVFQLAKKHRVMRLDADYHLFIKDPKALIKKFKETSLDESDCVSYRLTQLEQSLADSVRQANAWATGDIALLQSDLEAAPKNPCWQGFGDIGFVKELGIENIAANMDDAWMAAAEKSLSDHEQSFGLLEMSDVLLPTGILATLKARGYTVLSPAEVARHDN